MYRIDCGVCRDCRLAKARDWSVRCAHEAELYEGRCLFIDLTYADEHLPKNGVEPKVLTQFIKDLRNKNRSLKKTKVHVPDKYKDRARFENNLIRYFGVGEYGEKFSRPHYHVILFNWDDPKRYFWKRSKKGTLLYRSPILDEIWTYGHVTCSTFSPECAAYAARYTLKKITGEPAHDHYLIENPDGTTTRQNPEFQRQSNRPGIGHDWIEQHWKETFARDFVIVNGKKLPVPKYYDTWLKVNENETYQKVKQKRIDNAPEPESGLRSIQSATARDQRTKTLKRDYESGHKA